MESFRPPAPLRLNSSNLEAEWSSFEKKFNWFLVAIGADKKPDGTKLAMLLTTVGDEAVKVFEAFTYDESESAERFDVVVRKFREYCTPVRNIVYERFLFWQHAQTPGESIDQYVTRQRHLAKSCNFMEEDNMIRDHIVFTCLDARLKERLLREIDLTLAKATALCRAAEAAREQIKTLSSTDYRPVQATSTSNVHAVQHQGKPKNSHNNSSRVTASNQAPRTCRNCGQSHRAGECRARNSTCRACGKLGHYENYCITTGRQPPPPRSQSRPRSKGDSRPKSPAGRSPRPVYEVTDQPQDQSSDGIYVGTIQIHSMSTTTRSWTKTLQINSTAVECKLDSGAEANCMPYSTFLTLKHLSHIRPTSELLSGYTDASPARPRGVATLKINYKGQFYKTDFYIVNHEASVIVGLPTCIELNLIKRIDYISSGVPSNNDDSALLTEFADIFSGTGEFPGEHHITIDPAVQPVIHATRRVALAVQPKLKQLLDQMVQNGILIRRDEPTDWVNSLVVVQKSNGQLRVCLDPRDLNRAIKREHFVIPTFADIAPKLHGKRIFSVIDMKDGFWHIRLDEASSKLCTFNSIFGRYSYTRLPFGIASAPEVFQKRANEIFGDIPDVFVIFDDLLIAAASDEEHEQTLRKVFERAREKCVRFNRNKIQLRVRQCKYIGHLLTPEGICPDPDKVKAISDMAPPADAKELHRLQGMVTYLSKFVPHLADLTAPLRQLLRKGVSWSWTSQHERAFSDIKQAVTSTPVLQYFDPSKPVVIQTDASSTGLGSCLLQDGKPIEFTSRALTDAETRYAQIEKELLAIVFACIKFHQYIYGRPVTVQSDHKPLESVFQKTIASTTPRLQRMLLRLLEYNISVQYTPGREMHIADTLSRSYLREEPPSRVEREIAEDTVISISTIIADAPVSNSRLDKIRQECARDEEIQLLREYLHNGFPGDNSKLSGNLRQYRALASDLYEQDGLILHNNRIVIPSGMQKDILFRIHEGHLGMDKCKALARSAVFWPGINQDIENTVGRCPTCNMFRHQQTAEPLSPHPVPLKAYQKVGADIFTLHGKDYLLVVDYFSKFPEYVQLNSKSADCVIQHLKDIFSRHGIPETLISDNNPFSSFAMRQFAEEWGFENITSSPRYPRSNGQVERFVQTVKQLMRKAVESNQDVAIALLQYRNASVAGCEYSPAQLLFNRSLRTRIPTLPITDQDPKRSDLQLRQERQKFYHDRRSRPLPPLQPGDAVRVQNGQSWQAAKVIAAHPSPRSYNIETNMGTKLRRNRRDLISTREDPPVCARPVDEDEPPVTSPPVTRSDTSKNNVRPSPCIRTASGRTVKPPVRFRDYIMN